MKMYSIAIFQEAQNHCRWKKVLDTVLKEINISIYENKSFEQIFTDIYVISKNVRGIGLLTIYDITSAICRYYKININKVYIIGSGPKRAVRLLNIKIKKHKINQINLNYVDIIDIINAFDTKKYVLNETIKHSNNGDTLESYICNWQKTRA